MSELNSTYYQVAIGFQGEVTAQAEDNSTTKNFTAGCVATPILLDLNTTTRSVDGINEIIHTIHGTDVNFSRLIRYNGDPDDTHLEYNGTLPYIDQTLPVGADKFLDENNGTMKLDIRYNLNKHNLEPINPIQVTFHGMDVNATAANSISHDSINIIPSLHTPQGHQPFVDNVKNFYFSQVVSDLINYPRVNMHISSLVHTPLNVDIYCAASTSYCEDTNVILHSNWNSSERKQNHFYLSIHHNPELDGNVTALIPNPDMVTITPDPTPSGADDTTLANGRNGLTTTNIDNCSSPSCTIEIKSRHYFCSEQSLYG